MLTTKLTFNQGVPRSNRGWITKEKPPNSKRCKGLVVFFDLFSWSSILSQNISQYPKKVSQKLVRYSLTAVTDLSVISFEKSV